MTGRSSSDHTFSAPNADRKGSVRGSYGITGYIYNEYLKKERELPEKAKENVKKKIDHLRNGDNADTGDGRKKG